MIDEEINVPRGTDETLLNKILKTYAGSPLVKRFLIRYISLISFRAKPSGKDKNFLSSFVVTHYAGDVVYNIVGFLEKNKVRSCCLLQITNLRIVCLMISHKLDHPPQMIL